MRDHNVYFYKKRTIISKLSRLPLLIWSTAKNPPGFHYVYNATLNFFMFKKFMFYKDIL